MCPPEASPSPGDTTAAAAGNPPARDGLAAVEAPAAASIRGRLDAVQQRFPLPSPPGQHQRRLAPTFTERLATALPPGAKVLRGFPQGNRERALRGTPARRLLRGPGMPAVTLLMNRRQTHHVREQFPALRLRETAEGL